MARTGTKAVAKLMTNEQVTEAKNLYERLDTYLRLQDCLKQGGAVPTMISLLGGNRQPDVSLMRLLEHCGDSGEFQREFADMLERWVVEKIAEIRKALAALGCFPHMKDEAAAT